MTVRPLTFSVLGESARLARPEALWLLGVVAIVALLVLWELLARRRVVGRLVQAERLLPKVVPGLALGRVALARASSLFGLALLAFSVASPQCGERTELATRVGSDLVVAIDASASMLGRDILPSRLERSKLELAALIDSLDGDRVGIVAFAGDAFVQCPLTSDYAAAKLFLRAVDPAAMPAQGTAIAQALETAADMLESAERGPSGKALLLLSDGEDHEGDVERATARISAMGVRVFSLGVGTAEGTPVPVLSKSGTIAGYKTDRQGRTVVSKLEDRQLKEIAAATGGAYVQAQGADLGLGELRAELDKLEKSELESRLLVRYGEMYAYFALPGLLLVLLGAAIRPTSRRAP